MTIAEIIEIESKRTNVDEFNVVHFLKEGEFYRAHDWSAWIMSKFPFGAAAEKPMGVTVKRLKDGYLDAFVGFPVSSLGKYVPNDGSVEFKPVSDVQIDVVVELPVEIGEVSFENLNRQKEDWKNSLPLTEGKKKRREEREVRDAEPRITRISDVIGRVLAFQLESKSPIEAYDFLRSLRQDITKLF